MSLDLTLLRRSTLWRATTEMGQTYAFTSALPEAYKFRSAVWLSRKVLSFVRRHFRNAHSHQCVRERPKRFELLTARLVVKVEFIVQNG
jgi:protocatechuate 3,4-dioxygenase beta subunit